MIELPVLAFVALVVALAVRATAAEGTVFPGARWEEAAPESQGIDPAALESAMACLGEHVGHDGAKRAVVVRNGRLIWKGPEADRVQGVWSVTKVFTSTVLGLLVDDGKCTLDTRAAEILPAMAETYPAVTLRHFTTMTSGYRAQGDEPQGEYVHGPSKTPLVPSAAPLFAPPGSAYAYWDSAMNQFGNVLAHISGEPVRDLFGRRIADPIGIDPGRWHWGDPAKPGLGAAGTGSGNHNGHVMVCALDLARLGYLFLHRGVWSGRRLISEAWVGAATSVQVPADLPLAGPVRWLDGRGVYGYNWWVNGTGADGRRKWPAAPAGTFAASGFNNGKCFVVPEWHMVVVRLGLDGRAEDTAWNALFERLSAALAGTA